MVSIARCASYRISGLSSYIVALYRRQSLGSVLNGARCQVYLRAACIHKPGLSSARRLSNRFYSLMDNNHGGVVMVMTVMAAVVVIGFCNGTCGK
jgi:hypothetical protein